MEDPYEFNEHLQGCFRLPLATCLVQDELWPSRPSRCRFQAVEYLRLVWQPSVPVRPRRYPSAAINNGLEWLDQARELTVQDFAIDLLN